MPSKLEDGPSVKRQKLHDAAVDHSPKSRKASRIWAPFRTLGLVSPTFVPFTAIPLGKTTFQITTSVGRSLQTYDLRKGLHLVFVTHPQTPGQITGSIAWKDRVLAAWRREEEETANEARLGVWIFKRGRKIGELETPIDLDEEIVDFVILGPWIVGCCATKIVVWKSESLEHYTTLLPAFANGTTAGNILTGGICAVPTYTNKILAGRENGCVEIWNVSTGKLVYTIQPPTSDSGPVTALQPTPALSLVAIAYYNGLLVIQDVLHDREVIKIIAGTGDQIPVTNISFRSDGYGVGTDGRNPGMMTTASYNSGDVVVWDLNKGGRRIATLRNAHRTPSEARLRADGGISKMEFLPNQAILLTSGLDNSLRSWIFDETPYSPIPRPLHTRQGHCAPVTNLDFLPAESDGSDANGKWLLSSSQDKTLWGWSLRRDNQSTELSQGNIAKKAKQLNLGSQVFATAKVGDPEDLRAPEITCIACSLNRDGGIAAMPGSRSIWMKAKQLKGKNTETEKNVTGWESVVTGHEGDRFARTWFWGRKRAGRWALETGDHSPVTSVAISPCGTFALVGSEAGGIDMYNLQSGMHRQRFPARLTKAQAARLSNSGNGSKRWARGQGKHTRAVIGLEVDGLNRTVVSAGSDGKVKFWDFHSGDLIDQVSWGDDMVITKMVYHRPNDLIAITCNDLHIRIIDMEARRVVRNLTGHKDGINDLCFSYDGRWVIAASKDSTVRVWDLPTGAMIDGIRLRSPCSSLSFSSTGEFLAVALENSIGIDLWTNRTFFAEAPTRAIQEGELAVIEGPTASGQGGQNLIAAANEEAPTDGYIDIVAPDIEQISKDTMTLSRVPRSRWQTLINLDAIRARNKPIEPPKAPEKAPFFLPSLIQPQEMPRPLIDPDGNTNTFFSGGGSGDESSAATSRFMSLSINAKEQDTFSALLRSGASSSSEESYNEFIKYLKTLHASATDIEIRSLSPVEPYTELTHFVDALTQRLELRRDYELVQAWMSVFLKCHGEVIQEAVASMTSAASADIDATEEFHSSSSPSSSPSSSSSALIQAIRRWRAVQRVEAQRLNGLLSYSSGVLSFLRSSR